MLMLVDLCLLIYHFESSSVAVFVMTVDPTTTPHRSDVHHESRFHRDQWPQFHGHVRAAGPPGLGHGLRFGPPHPGPLRWNCYVFLFALFISMTNQVSD